MTVTADRATFNPGDLVTFTLTIKWSSIRVGGAFITTGGVGTLQALAGEGLAVNAQGLTHTAPKAAVGGAVTFRFGWQAPSKPGAVDVQVAALAGNGNNASTGDSPGGGEFQGVFGCPATTFYLDLDRDGYGAKNLGTRLGCLGDPAPTGFATMDGDCDENNEMVHPGATEVCNLRDDDCNGQTDENAPPVMMWPDGDGDGYYGVQAGTPKLGCGNTPGYATRGGDCDDKDAAIHPGATELCNNKDDNCDGQIDERVRPRVRRRLVRPLQPVLRSRRLPPRTTGGGDLQSLRRRLRRRGRQRGLPGRHGLLGQQLRFGWQRPGRRGCCRRIKQRRLLGRQRRLVGRRRRERRRLWLRCCRRRDRRCRSPALFERVRCGGVCRRRAHRRKAHRILLDRRGLHGLPEPPPPSQPRAAALTGATPGKGP